MQDNSTGKAFEILSKSRDKNRRVSTQKSKVRVKLKDNYLGQLPNAVPYMGWISTLSKIISHVSKFTLHNNICRQKNTVLN